MSGFGIAGIALAAFLFSNESLEYFVARSETLVRYRELMTELIHAMNYQHIRFRWIREKLLVDFGNRYEITKLVESPFKELPLRTLAEGLEAELGSKVQDFRHVLQLGTL